MKRIVTVLIAWCYCLSALAQETRHIADSIRFRRRVPALVYAVISSDKVFLKEGVGYRQFRTKDSISLDNRFHLGPATASITSFIAAQLVAKGKIFWNTPLLKLYPAFAAKCRPEFRGITLVDLLSQQSGLLPVNEQAEFTIVPVFPGSLMQQRAAFAQWVIQQRVGKDTIAKKTFHFSNANTAVAVTMLEKAAGKPWEDLLHEFVNKPLGIAVKTGWPIKQAASETMGHWEEPGAGYVALDNTHWFTIPGIFAGAADANITVGDYIKFIQDQLRGLHGQKSVLPARSYELMHYTFPGYALGWVNLEVNGNHISECDGTLGTFYSHVEIIKEKDIAIIVFCNSGDNSGKGAVINLAKILRGMYVKL